MDMQSTVQNAKNLMAICVDEWDSSELSGRLYHTSLGEHYFCSLENFFQLFEQPIFAQVLPQAVFEQRSFRPTKRGKRKQEVVVVQPVCNQAIQQNNAQEEFAFSHGAKGTFMVRVYYCQNASWQGTVQWMDEGKTQNFRSMLELIHLMNDALGDDQSIGW